MLRRSRGISGYIEGALRVIVAARTGRIKCGDALDSLWEFLTNLDYELRRGVGCEAYFN
ncbi:hypothetical protein [Vulcanisaeta thermophila]|uniref:hypothetical protein n=1 Tax=Vulcanisaeta thermophila TaxID=867917 RepID=UPI00138A64B4|nr:hypothetical protein [Vulcanisaeta thermophila]